MKSYRHYRSFIVFIAIGFCCFSPESPSGLVLSQEKDSSPPSAGAIWTTLLTGQYSPEIIQWHANNQMNRHTVSYYSLPGRNVSGHWFFDRGMSSASPLSPSSDITGTASRYNSPQAVLPQSPSRQTAEQQSAAPKRQINESRSKTVLTLSSSIPSPQNNRTYPDRTAENRQPRNTMTHQSPTAYQQRQSVNRGNQPDYPRNQPGGLSRPVTRQNANSLAGPPALSTQKIISPVSQASSETPWTEYQEMWSRMKFSFSGLTRSEPQNLPDPSTSAIATRLLTGRRNQEMQNWRHQYQYLAQQNQSPNGSPTNHFYNDNPEAIASNSGGLHLPGALVSTPSGIFSAAKFPMLETADNLQQSKPALTETFSGENQLLADTLSEVLPETASFSDPPILMDSLAKTENSDPQNLFNVPETKSTVPVSAQYPFYAVDLKNSDIFEDDMLPAYSSVRQASAQVPNTSQNLISQSSYFVQAQAASEKAVPEASAINSAGTMPERLTAAFPQTTAAPEVRPLNSDSTQNPPVPEESSGKLRVYRPTGSFLPIDTLNNQPVKPE